MIQVYRFGLAAPHENADLVREQILLGHRYRNTLVEIECGRRAALRRAEEKYGHDVERLKLRQAEMSAIARNVGVRAKAYRTANRTRKLPAQIVAELKEARAAEEVANLALREARSLSAADATVSAWRDVIGERALGLVRGARNLSGCFWGTYLLIEEAAKDSFSDVSLYGVHGEPTDPGFVRFDGSGAVGVQLQDEMSTEDILGEKSTFLRITPPPEGWWAARRCERRKLSRQAEISLRVGSDGQAPVWARWRLDMHRPLPPGARVTWAAVHRTRCGPHDAWHCTITIETVETAESSVSPKTEGAVALNLGWRVRGEEMRVASWVDEHGAAGELRLDATTLRLLRLPEQMRSERDEALNAIRAKIVQARSGSEWLREHASNAGQWKSPKQFVALLRARDEERPEGEREPWDRDLETYVANDRHAWAQQEHLRQRALRRRKDFYRVFAAQMTTRYGTLVVERTGGRERIARTPEVGDTRDQKQADLAAKLVDVARANRVVACTSELYSALHSAGRGRGRFVVDMLAEDITRTCPKCGCIEDRNAAETVQIACKCGHEWDQDVEGAAPELLARWLRERSGNGEKPVVARKPKKRNSSGPVGETPYDRRRRLRAAKVLRLETSRRIVDNCSEGLW